MQANEPPSIGIFVPDNISRFQMQENTLFYLFFPKRFRMDLIFINL